MVSVARRWMMLPVIFLALGIAGCSNYDPYYGAIIEADYPCWGFFGRVSFVLSDHSLAWTSDGSHVIFNLASDTVIWVVDAKGTQLRKLVDVNPSSRNLLLYGFHVDVSPDGTRIAYATCEYKIEPKRARPLIEEGQYHYEIAVIGLDGSGQRRLTVNSYLDHYPVWSPDSSRIAFIARPTNEAGREDDTDALFTMAADGSDVRQVVPPSTMAISLAPPRWLPDGETLALWGYTLEDDPVSYIYTVRTDGSEWSTIAERPRSFPAWSPDFRRFAVAQFVGEDGEELALYTRAADGSEPRLLTTITDRKTFERGDGHYRSWLRTLSWSPDGTHILYGCDLVVCVVSTEDGKVRGLIEDARLLNQPPYLSTWSPDGSRIAIYTPGSNEVPRQLYTVARDGTDRRDLIGVDADGNLAPANPPQDES